jgi:hypothetical protein
LPRGYQENGREVSALERKLVLVGLARSTGHRRFWRQAGPLLARSTWKVLDVEAHMGSGVSAGS